ncbi:Uncharacterized protein dnm_077350 [Desulfonema magnum]|uniref:Uncharacterized protein n=1 Tax=Desulfonema magnum TaxID=45655 RepID=A0A975GS88_9BACT|nr:Uncharacterized protein dnm_077350 [Desulfonema magnum]
MYSPVQPAFARHVRNISVFSEKNGGVPDISAEKTGGGQNDCQNFGIVHLCLTVIIYIHFLKRL